MATVDQTVTAGYVGEKFTLTVDTTSSTVAINATLITSALFTLTGGSQRLDKRVGTGITLTDANTITIVINAADTRNWPPATYHVELRVIDGNGAEGLLLDTNWELKSSVSRNIV